MFLSFSYASKNGISYQRERKKPLDFSRGVEKILILLFFFLQIFFNGSQSYALQSFGVDSKVSHSLYQVAVDL